MHVSSVVCPLAGALATAFFAWQVAVVVRRLSASEPPTPGKEACEAAAAQVENVLLAGIALLACTVVATMLMVAFLFGTLPPVRRKTTTTTTIGGGTGGAATLLLNNARRWIWWGRRALVPVPVALSLAASIAGLAFLGRASSSAMPCLASSGDRQQLRTLLWVSLALSCGVAFAWALLEVVARRVGVGGAAWQTRADSIAEQLLGTIEEE